MPRRVGLPGASELFRTTAPARPDASRPDAVRPDPSRPDAGRPGARIPDVTDAVAPPPSGRVKHDEKITVYVSSEELLALEQLRLTLRAHHGIAVDRGRIVRAAIAEALADVQARGGDSALVTRLTEP